MSAVLQSTENTQTLADVFQAAGCVGEVPNAASITMKRTLMPHQMDDVQETLTFDRFGVFNDPGTGKTFSAQVCALYYVLYGNRVLLVMPPILLEQFQGELDKSFHNWEQFASFWILNSSPADRQRLFKQWQTGEWPQMLAMSYQMFIKLLPCLTTLDRKLKVLNKQRAKLELVASRDTSQREPAVARLVAIANTTTRLQEQRSLALQVNKAGYNVLVADEAQALKSPKSQAHKSAKSFAAQEGGSAVMLLTGTPIPNTLLDAYGLLKLLRPDSYSSLKTFKRMHLVYNQNGDHIIDVINTALLSKRMKDCSRRVLKEDVFDLEKAQIIQVPLRLHKDHQALYRKLVKERMLEVDGQIIDAVQAQSLRMKCLRMVANPQPFSDHIISSAPLERLRELCDELGVAHREKLVVFAHFRSTIEMLVEALTADGLNPAVVYGGSRKHQEQKRKFIEDPDCRVFIANPKSGGVGLDGLQHVCRYACFVEPTSVPGDFKQACERLHRKGQERMVTVYLLRVTGTIAPRLIDSMVDKERAILQVTTDSRSLLSALLGEA